MCVFNMDCDVDYDGHTATVSVPVTLVTHFHMPLHPSKDCGGASQSIQPVTCSDSSTCQNPE